MYGGTLHFEVLQSTEFEIYFSMHYIYIYKKFTHITIYITHIYEFSVFIYIYITHENIRSHYRWFWVATGLLGFELITSGRATSAPSELSLQAPGQQNLKRGVTWSKSYLQWEPQADAQPLPALCLCLLGGIQCNLSISLGRQWISQ